MRKFIHIAKSELSNLRPCHFMTNRFSQISSIVAIQGPTNVYSLVPPLLHAKDISRFKEKVRLKMLHFYIYFLHSEKIIQMPLNWANCNQSKIWFCQIKIQEICNPTYFYQFFMSGWLPAIKWHWKKVAWSKLDKVSKNMAIIYSKWKLFCQKGIKLTPF